AVRMRRGWAVAAGVAGILIVSLSADPVRAWMMRRLPIAPVAPSEISVPEIALPPAVVGSTGSVISFPPMGASFELVVEAPQAEGEVLLQVLPIGRATAQITS